MYKLLIYHNLYVMHVEKNVCERIFGTLLDIKGKSKDGKKSRDDLQKRGLRKSLWPKVKGQKIFLPPAPHTLSKKEKQTLCHVLFMLKVPDGYSSNPKNHISMEELKFHGMKAHDCHVLMQQLLPVALRHVLPIVVRKTLCKLCYFYRQICAKSVSVESLDKLENDIVETLCFLEKYFTPSFFDIMLHLNVHLVRELRYCGPVAYRWMYPFERYVKLYFLSRQQIFFFKDFDIT